MKALKILTLAALISTAGINAAANVQQPANDFGVAVAQARAANFGAVPLTNDDIKNLRAAILVSGGNQLIVNLLTHSTNLEATVGAVGALNSAAQMFGINVPDPNGLAGIQAIAQHIDMLTGNANAAAAAAAADAHANNPQRARNVLGVLHGAIGNPQVMQAFNSNLGRLVPFAGNADLCNNVNNLIGAISQNNIDNIFNAAFNIAQGFMQHAAQQAMGLDNPENANRLVIHNNNDVDAERQRVADAERQRALEQQQRHNDDADAERQRALEQQQRHNDDADAERQRVADAERQRALEQQQRHNDDDDADAERQRVADAERQRVADAQRQRVADAERQRALEQPEDLARPKLTVEQIMSKTQLKRSIAQGIYDQVASKNGAVLGANDRLTNTGSLSSRQVADLETALRNDRVMVENLQPQQPQQNEDDDQNNNNNDDAADVGVLQQDEDDNQQHQARPKLTVEQIMSKTQLKRSIAQGIYSQVASKPGAVLGANDRLTNTGPLSSRQVDALEKALRHDQVMAEDPQQHQEEEAPQGEDN
jgi:hypothetical protein